MSKDMRKGLLAILRLVCDLLPKVEKGAKMVAEYEIDRRAKQEVKDDRK